MRGRARRRQRAEEGDGVCLVVPRETTREVDLIALARLDQGDDRTHAGLERITIETRFRFAERELGGPHAGRADQSFELRAGARSPLDPRRPVAQHEARVVAAEHEVGEARVGEAGHHPLDRPPEVVGEEPGPPPGLETVERVQGGRTRRGDECRRCGRDDGPGPGVRLSTPTSTLDGSWQGRRRLFAPSFAGT